jgi:hypothetical protein
VGTIMQIQKNFAIAIGSYCTFRELFVGSIKFVPLALV